MKFSVFTVGTPNYTIEETVKKLKQFGYDGVEWRISSELKKEPEVVPPKELWYWKYNKSTIDVDTILEKADYIKSLCKKNSIEICSLATYIPTSDVEKIEQVLKAAVIMECPRIRVWVSGYNGDLNYNKIFSNTVNEYKILESLAKKYNVKIYFEIHHGTISSSPSLAYRIASNFDSKYVGVIYDAGNMVHEGYEQYKMSLELLGDYLDHVHIKNANWVIKETRQNGEKPWECVWSPIKKGQVDQQNLISALKSLNYNGYLSFEDFSNDEYIDSKLEDNLKYIKSIINK